ncbi:MAG: hypothetical protein F6K22_32030, partial [Okeania sp. SIO2F4]|uniref:hypothetical protein n=1 Tax=Okeania sp. SIO2F4 TaxID=2607790 RepID=UPI00142A98C1
MGSENFVYAPPESLYRAIANIYIPWRSKNLSWLSCNETTIALYPWGRKKFRHPPPGASANEMTIAYRAIDRRKKFHHPSPGASANETTIALYPWGRKKFRHPPPGASANEMTIALYATEEKNSGGGARVMVKEPPEVWGDGEMG